MSKRLHLDIGGMSCINCQNKIQKALNMTDGVIKATASYSNGTADIEYDEKKINKEQMVKIIEKLDYKVLGAGDRKSPDIVETICFIVIIAALYYLIQSLGLLNRLVPDRLADTGMGYGMLFVIGLITSVHCIAMCGGINLSQSLPRQNGVTGAGNSGSTGRGKLQTFLPALSYNLGRVCSYTAIGFILGLVGMIIGGGGELGVSPILQGVLKIVAGLFMVIMGINLLGIIPALRRFTIRPPKALWKFIGSRGRVAKGPFAVGLLNGLMPCGPLQAMWIVALATGNPFGGALSMFLFSLGTVPLMLGLGSAVSLLGKKFTDQVMKAGAVLVVVLGLAMLTQGGVLAGIAPSGLFEMAGSSSGQKSYEGQQVAGEAENDTTQGDEITLEETQSAATDVQVINSTLELGRYPEITVKAGVPVKWIIDAPQGTLNGCNSVMLIQEYGIQHQFEYGENVIEFTPEETGTVMYSCWMGMVYGSINVVD